MNTEKIYVAGHRGMVGSAILRRLVRDQLERRAADAARGQEVRP